MDDNSTPQQTQNSNDNFSADYTQADQVQATPMAENIQMADTMAEVEVVEQQTLAQVDETGAPEPTTQEAPVSTEVESSNEPTSTETAESPSVAPEDTASTVQAETSSTSDDGMADNSDIDGLIGSDNDGEPTDPSGSFGLN